MPEAQTCGAQTYGHQEKDYEPPLQQSTIGRAAVEVSAVAVVVVDMEVAFVLASVTGMVVAFLIVVRAAVLVIVEEPVVTLTPLYFRCVRDLPTGSMDSWMAETAAASIYLFI